MSAPVCVGPVYDCDLPNPSEGARTRHPGATGPHLPADWGTIWAPVAALWHESTMDFAKTGLSTVPFLRGTAR